MNYPTLERVLAADISYAHEFESADQSDYGADMLYVMATEGGREIGRISVQLGPNDDQPAASQDNPIVMHVMVDDSHRRQGVAGKLLERAEEILNKSIDPGEAVTEEGIRFKESLSAEEKTMDKMDPAKFKYSNAQGFIDESGKYYQIRATHAEAMEQNDWLDSPEIVSVGHDGGHNVTFPYEVWEDTKAPQHKTLRLLLGALAQHGHAWDTMEVGLGKYWYAADKLIKVNPDKYMKYGPKGKIAA